MKSIALIERSLHKVYRGIYDLLRLDFDVDIISSDLEADTVLKETGSKCSTPFVWYSGLWTHLKKTNPDIICVRTYYRFYSLVALLFATLHRKIFVVFEEQNQDSASFFKNLLFKLALLFLKPLINYKATCIVCVTEPCFHYMMDHNFRKCIHIPIPYKAKMKLEEVNNEQDKLKIICVARLTWHKGINILIQAVARLIKDKRLKKKDIEVTLIGEGEMEEPLKRLAEKNGVDDIITFEGQVDNKKLDWHYQQHNLFVLPSRAEPIGMVVIEAMSNGLPVLISNKVGATNPSCIEFEDGNDRLLADAIYYFRNPKARQALGKTSLLAFRDYFSPSVIRNKYREALGC